MSRKEAIDKYNHSEKGLITRNKYNSSSKGQVSLRRAGRKHDHTEWRKIKRSKQTLRNALTDFRKLGRSIGWPDALYVEQKIGSDYVRVQQWRRAASLDVSLFLFFAKTHEDAVRGIGKYVSFVNYAKELGLKKEWKKLVAKERA